MYKWVNECCVGLGKNTELEIRIEKPTSIPCTLDAPDSFLNDIIWPPRLEEEENSDENLCRYPDRSIEKTM